MRKPQGLATWTTPEGKQVEAETFTCGHCQKIVFVKPKCDPADAGGLCKLCMTLICPKCAGDTKCDIFEKKLLRLEARDRLMQAMG